MLQTGDVNNAGAACVELAPFAATLSRAATRKQAFELLASLAHRMGFANLSLTIESSGMVEAGREPRWSTLEADKRERLEAIGFDGHDPVRRFARRVSDPFIWSHDDWPGDHSAASRTIMTSLQQASIEAGMTVVVWGRAGRVAFADAFACRQHVRSLPALTGDLLFLATAQTFRVIERMTAIRVRPELSAREIEILELSAQGLSARSIACRLRIVEPTVKFHFKSIRDKLNARNKAEAIARFTALGPSSFAPAARYEDLASESKIQLLREFQSPP